MLEIIFLSSQNLISFSFFFNPKKERKEHSILKLTTSVEVKDVRRWVPIVLERVSPLN
jgi:uncharacterized lipoprotein YbaY